MRVVFIGDIHLYDLVVPPWRLLGKRLLGQANLWLNRRKHFDGRLIGPVLERALSLSPDWLLFSGDLTTTSLGSEFTTAHQALTPALATNRCLIVPGNHDRYTFRATWARRFEAFLGDAAPQAYPHVMDLSPGWGLVALDSSRPRCVTSRGRVGRQQLAGLRRCLVEAAPGRGWIVLCHYPFGLPPGVIPRWTHALADAAELQETLSHAQGPVIFVHGHVHRPWQWRPTDWGVADGLVLNTGSPCMVSRGFPAGQGFWQMDFPSHHDEKPMLIRHTPYPEAGMETGRDARACRSQLLSLGWRVSEAQPLAMGEHRILTE